MVSFHADLEPLPMFPDGATSGMMLGPSSRVAHSSCAGRWSAHAPTVGFRKGSLRAVSSSGAGLYHQMCPDGSEGAFPHSPDSGHFDHDLGLYSGKSSSRIGPMQMATQQDGALVIIELQVLHFRGTPPTHCPPR